MAIPHRKVIRTRPPVFPAQPVKTKAQLLADAIEILEMYADQEASIVTRHVMGQIAILETIAAGLATGDPGKRETAAARLEDLMNDKDTCHRRAAGFRVVRRTVEAMMVAAAGQSPAYTMRHMVDRNRREAVRDTIRTRYGGNPFTNAVAAAEGAGRAEAYREIDQILERFQQQISEAPEETP